jgi:hypothetical protein
MQCLKDSLRFLSYSRTGHNDANDHKLPSWTPDYSHDIDYWPSACIGFGCFLADSKLNTRCSIEEGGKLLAAGCRCDVITKVEPLYKYSSEELRQFIGSYNEDKASASPEYPTGILRAQAIVRTVLPDFDRKYSQRLQLNQQQHQGTNVDRSTNINR